MTTEPSDEMDIPEDDSYGLVVPFVVCQSKGGPYDDASFVAGFEAGMIDRALQVAIQAGATEAQFTVHAGLVRQLELIAMNRGFPVVDVAETGVSGWSFATFRTHKAEGGTP